MQPAEAQPAEGDGQEAASEESVSYDSSADPDYVSANSSLDEYSSEDPDSLSYVEGCESRSDTPSEDGSSDDERFPNGARVGACRSHTRSRRAAPVQDAPPPAAPPASLRETLAKLGMRLRQKSGTTHMGEAAFRQHVEEVAAARRGDSPPSAVPQPASPASVPPSPEAQPAAGTPDGSVPTAGYSLPVPPAPPLELAPEGPERAAQIEELMERDLAGAVALAIGILRRLPTAQLEAALDTLYGEVGALDRRVLADRPAASGSSPPDSSPTRLGVDVSSGRAPAQHKERCWCCDEDFGDGDVATCTALQLLDGFGGEMEARDAEIEQELADGYDPALTYRQARWFFYRQYVFLEHGYLGKGNRVQIPDCVVAAIRARYPDPQCTCASTQEFVRCGLYTGYRASDSQQ